MSLMGGMPEGFSGIHWALPYPINQDSALQNFPQGTGLSSTSCQVVGTGHGDDFTDHMTLLSPGRH